MMKTNWIFFIMVLAIGAGWQISSATKPADTFMLFNGRDFTGWKVPENDGGHWRVIGSESGESGEREGYRGMIGGGVIDYDARSEADGGNDGRSLWTEESFRNFELHIDWRIKPEGGLKHRVPLIEPDGNYKKGADGAIEEVEIEDVDSGIYLRGTSKGQVNIWMWPVGSGEVWAYRKDPSMPAEVRAACTPRVRADKPRGEWNRFEITMKGDRLWVKLNGVEVIRNAHLPGIPEEGPIGLQHHGSWDEKAGEWRATYAPGRWSGAPSLVQFRDIWIRGLK